MALAPGSRLGPFEVLAQIGVGGMGEVYKATDTNLKRSVAIKVLPASVSGDAERLARFQREAEVLAALNHPNIAAIYGLERSGTITALVMELVEGPTLADRIAHGAIPVDEALPIAKQIAEALEAAHEQGIIHRDLKPANIKVRNDGTVKVLDFGLAKAMDVGAHGPGGAGRAGGDNFSQSPTITTPAMTHAGVILGTAAYMSPEQARGKTVDKRTDIWAFGCVLYEMLVGRRAFDGDDVSDTLAGILRGEPDWSGLAPGTPAAIRRLLRRSLEKDRTRRLSDMADARLDIDEALTAPSIDANRTNPVGVTVHTSRWRRALPWAIGVTGVAAAALMLVLWAPWRMVPSPVSLRLSAELGADASLDTSGASAAILSPDGTTLAFVAQKGTGLSLIYIRRLDQLQATPLSGTEGARDPFFSPDGQWIAFFSSAKLRKISVTGGAAVTLCDAPSDRGGSWGEDGTIVFVGNAQTGLSRVSSAGGKPEPITTLAEGELTQRFPQLLPGGKGVLYTAGAATNGFDDASIVVQPLPTGSRKIVQRGGYYARYLPSGHLVYIHEGTMFAAPFDLDRLELTRPPLPALESVWSDAIGSTVPSGIAQFAFSVNGTLVYLPGQGRDAKVPIEWMDRGGKATLLRTAPASWRNLRFAPDGRRIAMDIIEGGRYDVWVYEWARDTLTRLTFGGSGSNPVWTPDGQRIVFTSMSDSGAYIGLSWRRSDGTGDLQRLTESKVGQVPTSWDPSGKLLAFQEQDLLTNWDMMVLPLEGNESVGWKPGKPTVVLKSPANELMPMFSPDGRWLAYRSSESGRYEVYVRPFPGPDGKWQISTDGGSFPKWSRSRRELFYSTVQGQIMVVAYGADGTSFRPEKPRPWSGRRFAVSTEWSGGFDLHPDGDRFALATIPDAQAVVKQDEVVFIFNFFDELRRLSPASAR